MQTWLSKNITPALAVAFAMGIGMGLITKRRA